MSAMSAVRSAGGGDMVTPYLKGNVGDVCPACDGSGQSQTTAMHAPFPCRTCKGRGFIGKPADQIITETIAAHRAETSGDTQ